MASRGVGIGALLFASAALLLAAGCEQPTTTRKPSASASAANVVPPAAADAAPPASALPDARAAPPAPREGNTLGMPNKRELLPLAAEGESCRACFFNARCALLVLSEDKLPCCDYASGTVAKRPMPKDAHVDECLAVIGAGGYPTGKACADPKALANEHRTLPPRELWLEAQSPAQRITTRVPPDVFSATDGPQGFILTSSVKANGLGGPDAKPIPFAIRIRRVARSIDDILAEKTTPSLLAGAYVEGPFPKRTEQSFTPSMDDDAHVGSASKLQIRGLTAYAFVSGGHGYNNDTVLVRVGPKDTLVVRADWNSSIMVGQPECWQRQIIAGVVDQLNVH